MLDFVKIRSSVKQGRKKDEADSITIFPEFTVMQSEDLLVKGGKFYAVWDEDNSIWSRDPMKVVDIVDKAMDEKVRTYPGEALIEVKWMREWSSHKWLDFKQFVQTMEDSDVELDSKVIFLDDNPQKEDYVSRKLSYPLKNIDIPAYDELMSTLYDPMERQKLEWAIGSIFTGGSKSIQKFVVLYGEAGSGKSTVLNIIEELFEKYCAVFEARALTSKNNSFALEAFQGNPLVAIDHDGDLSKIEDNTRLNSVVSHEHMMINEKYKSPYKSKFNAFLFVGTNTPVKITNAKAGLMRRLIEVNPSGNKLSFDRYRILTAQIKFELPGIAWRCIQVYSDLGINAYDSYRPTSMIGATNDFYNFVEESYEVFARQDYATLNQAWEMYRNYADEAQLNYPMGKRAVKEELKNYFSEFASRSSKINGTQMRNVYFGFKKDTFIYGAEEEPAIVSDPMLELNSKVSIFDKMYSDSPAQYANGDGTPMFRWDNVKTELKDIDTSELHYVRVPENHIVIDFDIQDANGEKSLARNLKAASKWPETYAELSKSGKGVHLHYIYEGDVSKLASAYDEHIEVKVFTGKSSLRRKLTRCNDSSIKKISSGLPLKKGGKVVDFEGLKNERALRTFIKRNLNKDIHPGTKPSVEFILKGLQDAYESGMHYDVTDMRQAISNFAAESTHHSLYCLKLVQKMLFKSEEPFEGAEWEHDTNVFYDVEVFSNLFVVVYKAEGKSPITMINPTPSDIENLCKFKLIGFNNRRYDNHIVYARMMGYTNEQLFALSQKIISGSKNAMFREAYNLSYADIYDFCSKKQSLKKWEIELGIHHQELGLPWDKPVDESLWDKVASYCVNDVLATEEVFKARQADFRARKLLADLSGLNVNDTTRMHATKIIFGNDKHPQDKFVYTDLSEMFPGYRFELGKSTYRGEDPSEGGYVYSEPGMYENVALLDIESMHPTSLEQLNLFGPYTERFSDIKKARLMIKHGDYESAKNMLDGKLAAYLGNESDAGELSYALKIIINSVYGYTSARFDCEFRDPRNVDNIVAKRGALFMIDLKHAIQEKGYSVVHIKTDSVKIPNADKDIIDFVIEFGNRYGYHFELEAIYDKLCLVNDAVYICRDKEGWHATGAQFAVPYIFKTLFSGEPLVFEDFCETKTVTGASSLYLDMNEGMPEGKHNYVFIGRAGQFTPILPGRGGGILYREKDGKYYAAVGTKGYRWMESEMVKTLGKEGDIDVNYYEEMAEKAKETISAYGDYEQFIS